MDCGMLQSQARDCVFGCGGLSFLGRKGGLDRLRRDLAARKSRDGARCWNRSERLQSIGPGRWKICGGHGCVPHLVRNLLRLCVLRRVLWNAMRVFSLALAIPVKKACVHTPVGVRGGCGAVTCGIQNKPIGESRLHLDRVRWARSATSSGHAKTQDCTNRINSNTQRAATTSQAC